MRPGHHDADYLWAPCDDGADDDDYCADVLTNPLTGYAIDDATVMDAVIESIERGVGPRDRQRPDLTFVNMHQVDSAGHFNGVGPTYDAAIEMADEEIRRLVEKLRVRREWGRTALILVSDHSMDTVPMKFSLTDALTGGGIDESDFLVIQAGSADYVYLANRRAANRFALLKRMRQVALATPGVTGAFYREPNPQDGGRTHTINRRFPGHAGPRTGDLLVFAAAGRGFSDEGSQVQFLPGMHGGMTTADNFLAVVSRRPPRPAPHHHRPRPCCEPDQRRPGLHRDGTSRPVPDRRQSRALPLRRLQPQGPAPPLAPGAAPAADPQPAPRGSEAARDPPDRRPLRRSDPARRTLGADPPQDDEEHRAPAGVGERQAHPRPQLLGGRHRQ